MENDVISLQVEPSVPEGVREVGEWTRDRIAALLGEAQTSHPNEYKRILELAYSELVSDALRHSID